MAASENLSGMLFWFLEDILEVAVFWHSTK